MQETTTVNEPAVKLKANTAEHITLEEAMPGGVFSESDKSFLLLTRNFADVHKNAAEISLIFPNAIKILSFDQSLNGLQNTLGTINPSKILFLDIETCGLTLEPLFLIGAGHFTGDNFKFYQMFARDFSEERALISFFKKFVSDFELLVTYNGRSFDLPYILSRAASNNIDLEINSLNLDLLLEVRRKWKPKLTNCKLQTVEKEILGRKRVDDIPGEDIPAAYYNFVDTGNACDIRNILEHNLVDVVTLIEILILFSQKF